MSVPPTEVAAFAGDPKAALVILHGLAEYAARYQWIADEFAAQGISTFAFDQSGHGAAAKVRTHVERFDLFVDEASIACSKFIAKQPGVPLFVWGHSMGSIVALQLVLRPEVRIEGLIVSSNSLEVFKRGLNPLNPFFRLASRIAGRIRIPLGLDVAKLSHEETVQREYASSPLIPTTASLRLIVEFANACELVRNAASEVRTPALIVHGETDEIAPAKASQILFDLLGSSDKTLKIFPGLRHELQNERASDRARFAELVANWILARARR